MVHLSLLATSAASSLAAEVRRLCFRIVSWVPQNGFAGISGLFRAPVGPSDGEGQVARWISSRMERAAHTNNSAPSVVVTAAALAGLVSRKLVSRAVNPRDNREVLVCLTRSGLIAHETIVAGALERNRRLLDQLSKDEVAMLLGYIDRLTDTAAAMLEAEKELS
jgi:hypothetical protein